jgi:predicted glycoside hydrolase/deacetylase ChbG (UPF0249 family)
LFPAIPGAGEGQGGVVIRRTIRPLIVNADDFGLAEAVNDGIADAYRAGCLSSASLLVNAPAAAQAALLARKLPGLGVGLHFNLTFGAPVAAAADVESLLDADGRFLPRARLVQRLLLRRVQPRHVATELEAQLARMWALGLAPTHLDSRQHVHAFPVVFDAIATQCHARRLPMRVPWVLRFPGSRLDPVRRGKRWLLKRMLGRNLVRWRGQVRWNGGLGSVFDLSGRPERLDQESYRRLLAAALSSGEGPFELLVHPAREAGALAGLTGTGAVRVAEWRYLASGRLRELMAEYGFSLRTYAQAFA